MTTVFECQSSSSLYLTIEAELLNTQTLISFIKCIRYHCNSWIQLTLQFKEKPSASFLCTSAQLSQKSRLSVKDMILLDRHYLWRNVDNIDKYKTKLPFFPPQAPAYVFIFTEHTVSCSSRQLIYILVTWFHSGLAAYCNKSCVIPFASCYLIGLYSSVFIPVTTGWITWLFADLKLKSQSWLMAQIHPLTLAFHYSVYFITLWVGCTCLVCFLLRTHAR